VQDVQEARVPRLEDDRLKGDPDLIEPDDLDLKILARGNNLSVEEYASDMAVSHRIALGEHGLRKQISILVMITFAVLNLAVFLMLVWLDWRDLSLIAAGELPPENRLISTELLMTIIGAIE